MQYHNSFSFFSYFFYSVFLCVFLTWAIFKVFIEFVTILLLFYALVFGHESRGILALWPGMEPQPPALGGKVLTTARDLPVLDVRWDCRAVKDVNDSFCLFFSFSLPDGHNPFPPSSFFCLHILVSMLHVISFPRCLGDLWSFALI